MKKISLIVLTLLILSGCAYSNIKSYGSINLNNKSITIQPGGGQLIGDIKDVLYRSGWILKIDSETEKYDGNFGSKTTSNNIDVYKYKSYKTRYRLLITANYQDICIIGGTMYSYNLSIIDNNTDTEVLNMYGRDCSNTIITKLQKALKHN